MNLDVQAVKTPYSQALRYLGYNGQQMSPKLEQDMERCIREVERKASIRYVCRHFPLKWEREGIRLCNTNLILTGRDIARLLEGCPSCYLFAATLGPGVDQAVRARQQSCLSDAVMMDSAATALIEAVCDQAQQQLADKAAGEGRMLTWRYSCGYGDLPLALQPQFLETLDAQRQAGITCMKTNLMLPQKSVTAIWGVTDKPKERPTGGCQNCSYNQSCGLRKAGKSCGFENITANGPSFAGRGHGDPASGGGSQAG